MWRIIINDASLLFFLSAIIAAVCNCIFVTIFVTVILVSHIVVIKTIESMEGARGVVGIGEA